MLPDAVIELAPNPKKARLTTRIREDGGGGEDDDGCAPTQSAAFEQTAINALAEHGDSTSTICRWDSENELFFKCNGPRQCPCGNHHDNNNFHIVFKDGIIWYRCSYTGQNCLRKDQKFGTIPAMWNAEADERYTHHRPGTTKPAVKPYAFPPGVRAIVERTDCGGGETLQLYLLILEDHTTRTAIWVEQLCEERLRQLPTPWEHGNPESKARLNQNSEENARSSPARES